MRDMNISPRKLKTETKNDWVNMILLYGTRLHQLKEKKAATSLIMKTFCVIWKSSVICMIFTSDSMVKNPPANAGDAVSIPGSGRSPGEGNAAPLQYPCMENSMDRGTWQATIHGVAKDLDTT